MFSIVSTVYAFIISHYDKPTWLWPSVIGELVMLRDLLPLAYSDATRVWDDVVIASDACEWGYGACFTIASCAEVRTVGSVHER